MRAKMDAHARLHTEIDVAPARVYGTREHPPTLWIAMSNDSFWIHPATYTYRFDEPERMLETLWCERPGWGYLRRRDLWLRVETTAEELDRQGFVPRLPPAEDGARLCPYCGMYICGIPGFLVEKHLGECRGGEENWMRLEDILIDDVRRTRYERKILEQQLREQAELAEAEKRERFDRIREENAARQQSKDRKARLRRETKEELRNR
jgi:hypothetical protein